MKLVSYGMGILLSHIRLHGMETQINKIVLSTFAKIINEVLDEPVESKLGMKVVRAILKVVADALHKEDEVYVQGFGTFSVHKPKEFHKIPNIILHRESGVWAGQATKAPGFTIVAGRKKVIFKPAIQLLAMLNHNDIT